MNDSDPRPMPPQVLAAYRDPLNLTNLLASAFFTESDRFVVRKELLDRLIRKHGNIEVAIRGGSRTLPIRTRVAQFKKDVLGSIEVMMAAEEFDGRDAVMLELAAVMQPFWLRRWEAMSLDDYGSARQKMKIVYNVLGDRQLAWIAAQYARVVIDMNRNSDREVAVDAILAAEAWSIVPSEGNRAEALRASYNAMTKATANAATFAAGHAASSACSYVSDSSAAAYGSAFQALAPTLGRSYSGIAAARSRLSELTKQLITPTLITHASGALR
jgi:hypothetical protein